MFTMLFCQNKSSHLLPKLNAILKICIYTETEGTQRYQQKSKGIEQYRRTNSSCEGLQAKQADWCTLAVAEAIE
jgi:hypothetical protein